MRQHARWTSFENAVTRAALGWRESSRSQVHYKFMQSDDVVQGPFVHDGGPMISNGNAPAGESLAKCSGNRPWHGGKILVVEDNYLQAEVISDFLRDCGLEPIGPVGRLKEGCQLAGERGLDGALLDVKLDNVLCFPIAVILNARKIPFIFLTGYSEPSVFPAEFRAAPVVCKPFKDEELRAALGSIVNRREGNRNPLEVTARLSLSMGFTDISSARSFQLVDRPNAHSAGEPDHSARGR